MEPEPGRPFRIAALRPIQMSNPRVLEALAAGRRSFTTEQWIDFLIRSVGLEPGALDEGAKRVALLRMIPFVERNYNLVELGPRGTGKSHLYQQISPYAHLISGGKATVAKMFVNMGTGQRGLVCQYDVVCFDEADHDDAAVGPDALLPPAELTGRHVPLHDVHAVLLIERDPRQG